jgi:hypothetical protein
MSVCKYGNLGVRYKRAQMVFNSLNYSCIVTATSVVTWSIGVLPRSLPHSIGVASSSDQLR